MRPWFGFGAFATMLLLWTHPAGAASLMIRNAVVKVTVIPQDRTDIDIKVIRANPRLPLTVQPGLNGDVIVDGSRRYGFWGFLFGGRTTDCHRDSDEPVVHVWGVGDVRGDDMPQIVVQVPMDARVSTGGATFGSVGRSNSLDLHIAGCDDWTIANVAGRLMIDDAGVARVRAGTSGSLDLRIAGFSDVKTADVANGMIVHIAGAGEVATTSVSGPVEMHIAGHGDVKIDGGHASTFDVHIAGSGDIDDRGQADTLNAEIVGAGTVNIAKVNGAVAKSIAGMGTVNIGR